jgi:hypothetical protein
LPDYIYGDVSDKDANKMAYLKNQQNFSGYYFRVFFLSFPVSWHYRPANGWRDRDYFRYLKNNKFLRECNNELGVYFNPSTAGSILASLLLYFYSFAVFFRIRA